MNIRDIAREYQKATFAGLPFSGTDDDLLKAMIQHWKEDEKRRQELSNIKSRMIEISKELSEMFDIND